MPAIGLPRGLPLLLRIMIGQAGKTVAGGGNAAVRCGNGSGRQADILHVGKFVLCACRPATQSNAQNDGFLGTTLRVRTGDICLQKYNFQRTS